MRGYGGTDAPADIEQYTLLHLVGDMVDLVRCWVRRSAVIVGHDWGAAVAWHARCCGPTCSMRRGGHERALHAAGQGQDLISSAGEGRHPRLLHAVLPGRGVAEAELEADPAASIRRIHYSGSGDGPARSTFGRPAAPACWPAPQSSPSGCRTG
jgi:hypothetical protein